MKKRVLAIDDCRELGFADVLCRTVNDGIFALKHMGPWDELHLDHDMGRIEQQYTETGRVLNGHDVLCFLEEFPEYTPKKIIIVTANPSARPKMELVAKKLTK